MCSRHQPENGADSIAETGDRRDEVCDQCARTIYGPLRKTTAGLWICDRCHYRNEARYAAMTS